MSNVLFQSTHPCSICGEQTAASREVEPRCALHVDTEVTKLSRQVAEFHKTMELPSASRPTIPSADRVRLRLRLIAEEFFEALDSCFDADAKTTTPFNDVLRAIDESEIKIDLPEFIDALADIDYVVEGTRLEFGINGAPIADEVHRSNMSKVGGEIRADGKKMKGPNFTPLDIIGELKKQGWEVK